MEPSLRLSRIDIPFRRAFKHHAAERSATESVWVEARAGDTLGVGEGCPRAYVTGEDLTTARDFFDRHRDDWSASIDSVDALVGWSASHEGAVDDNPAAWCAVELALLDLLARLAEMPVERTLALDPLRGSFQYTAVLGDDEPDRLRATARRYADLGFSDFKLKLSGTLERDRGAVTAVRDLGIDGLRLRVDANNMWSDADDAARHIIALDHPFTAIEEPLAPGRHDELRRVADRVRCRIVLDESLLRPRQLASVANDPERWIANVRVSKMGGLVRSLGVVRRAAELGIPVIVGAQVGETSVLTRAGLAVAHAARDGLLAQEGAFGTLLLAADLVEPSLTFGRGGRLDVDALGLGHRPGWGLTPVAAEPFLGA